ncbi:MAG: uroporphyrinogen-III synthase [Planctomycetota bacterium]|nr:uroporphyrinogen-III synthase [Planctomycetota bacterium]
METPTQSGPLVGKVVALAEYRFLDALAGMLTREGATTLRVPLVSILDTEDTSHVDAWIDMAKANGFDLAVFMTGEGIRRLAARADLTGQKTSFVAGLSKIRILTRGPKPVAALRELGLGPSFQAPAPTTDGLITALGGEDLRGKSVGVQLHGNDNPPLITAIESAGATAHVVKPYRYAPATDSGRVVDFIRRMGQGEIDLLAITSSPQVDRLFEVAHEAGLEAELHEGLKKTLIASVGPVASATLERLGVRVDVCPEDGFVMKKLVMAIRKRVGGV